MSDKRFTAIIADDEELLRQALAIKLEMLWPELDIRGRAENGIQALEMMETLKPDIAFLDIRMPGMTGMEAARKAPGGVMLVFITAYDRFAVEAFDSEAVDYVLKPVEEARLAKTVARLKKRIQQRGDALAGESGQPDHIRKILHALEQHSPAERLRLIKVKTGDALRLVPVSQVLFFKAEDKYTVVRTRENEFLIKTPVKTLENQLDPDRFWRVHRGAIVNIDRISAVKRSFTNQMMVCFEGLADTVPVSRSYTHLFAHM